MKSKKRHQTSSEESEESEASVKSSSSSGSESEDSSESEHRHKKKRKRADSSESESDSDDQKRAKKRKHKKKKKKHGKKKRRSHSVESVSAEEFSLSDGEISSKKKKKHKHKHSKRARSTSGSEDGERVERRLHSVVKERRASSEEGSQPSRTYYQRDYGQTAPREEREFDRESEVQRFYRGSSKDRSHHYSENYHYDRDRNDKYSTFQDKNYRAKYSQNEPYNVNNEEYSRRPREMVEYKRHHKYEERRPPDEFHGRTRDAPSHKEDPRAYNQNRYHNQYEERGPRRREYDENREYRDRRAPPEAERYREYPDKRERYQDRYPTDRPRDTRRERPPRPDKPFVPPPPREYSRSPDRERSRRPEVKEERDDRYRGARGDGRDDRNGRDHRDGRDGRDGRGDERRERKDDASVKEERPRERKSRFGPDDNKEYSWGKTEVKKEGTAPGDKEKPNFGLSGKLTADTNTVNGVVIKYTQPEDAKQPKRRWRFYPFKGDKALPILYIHRQSAFLIGRDKKVVDIILEHPSVSKQHAALQYRATPFTRPDGTTGRRVRPYIIDLESANGTFVNNKKIEPRRYVELLERDVVKFGFSQREYVLLHENSKDDAQDDDNQDQPNVTTTDQIKIEKRVKQEVAEDGE